MNGVFDLFDGCWWCSFSFFLSFLILICFCLIWFDDIEWVRMNGSCLLKNENENEWNLVWEWTNKLNFNFLLFSARERNAVFSSFPIYTTFLEWHFREQKHLKRENGNEMEKYLLLVNRQCSKMNLLHNECCFQWDLECLIKSNQIKSYFPISHIPYSGEYHFDIPEFEWVKEDLNNHQNTIHISFQFNSIYILFMINVLS